MAPSLLRHVASLIPPGREILIHSTRTSHIQVWPTFYLIRMSHSRHSIRSTSHFLRMSHSRHSIRPTSHFLRMSHSRHSIRPTSHFLWMSHSRNSIQPTFHLLRIFHIRRLPPDGRGGRFNFPGQTCPDPLMTLTRTAWLVRHSRFAGSISAHNKKDNSDNTDDQVS